MTSCVSGRELRNPRTCSSICAAHRKLHRTLTTCRSAAIDKAARYRRPRRTIRLRLSCGVGRLRLGGSVLNSKFQTALEGKAEGNLFSAASELLKFLASREQTQFPISKSHSFVSVVAMNIGLGRE